MWFEKYDFAQSRIRSLWINFIDSNNKRTLIYIVNELKKNVNFNENSGNEIKLNGRNIFLQQIKIPEIF